MEFSCPTASLCAFTKMRATECTHGKGDSLFCSGGAGANGTTTDGDVLCHSRGYTLITGVFFETRGEEEKDTMKDKYGQIMCPLNPSPPPTHHRLASHLDKSHHLLVSRVDGAEWCVNNISSVNKCK